jgi:hypothetical protein
MVRPIKLIRNALGGLLLSLAFGLAAPHAGAQVNAASCNASDVQTAINSATNGQTVNVPAGTCTWAAQVVNSGNGVTLSGQTVCTPNGTPGTSGYSISCTDSTVINLNANQALNMSNCSATSFCRVTGFTFVAQYVTNGGANLQMSGTHGQVSFRFDHNHFIMPNGAGSNYVLALNDGYGLADDNYFQDTNSTAPGSAVMALGGDFNTHGYLNWNDPTMLGTNQAIYLENNYYSTSYTNSEGFFDGYFGVKVVARYNTIIGNKIGGWHGTDSGNMRSGVYGEIYDNYVTNSSGTTMNIGVMRGGTMLFWNNAIGGSSQWNSVTMEYNRVANPSNTFSGFGSAGPGLNWTPVSTDPTQLGSDQMTLDAPDWTANHTYAAGATLGPQSNDSGGFDFQNQGSSCTSGGSYPGWTQSVDGTTNDGGCTWTNVGGTTTPSQSSTAGFCLGNPDTMAVTNAICSALLPGDTATRYFDAKGGVYPYRDQPGRGHNQQLFPAYEWSNSGPGLPNPVFQPADSGTASIVTPNRDYADYTASFNGSSGVGTGLLASRPVTCTPYVAYWATDTNSLYQCSAPNLWSLYYVPYTYPYPVMGNSSAPAPATDLQAAVH